MGSYEMEFSEEGYAVPPRKKRAKHHKSTAEILIITLILAMICVVAVFLAIYASGLRYIRLDTEIGGYVKFFGMVQNDVPYKGDLYYSDGTTAKVDMLNHKVTFSNGSVYTGALNASLRMEGEGTLVYNTGDMYEGTFEDGVISGEGTFTYANGDTYVGSFAEGKKNGDGVYTWFDGSTYTGSFKDDKKDGEGTYVWADGSSYIGGYKDDLKDGYGTYRFTNGDIYTGDFVADARTGEGTYTWAAGDEYVGEFSDNEMSGHGVYRFASGRTYEGTFENGAIVRETETDDSAETAVTEAAG